MHAPLGVPARQAGEYITTRLTAACADLIEALEKCHAKTAWLKFVGGCNEEKLALNMCLRKEVRGNKEGLTSAGGQDDSESGAE